MRKLDYYGFIEQSEYESLASMGRSKNNEQDAEIGELGKKNEEQDTKIGEIKVALDGKAEKSEIPNVKGYFDGVAYDSEKKEIVFTHEGEAKASIDATDFIKDGMVEKVEIKDEKLVITFNTDGEHEAIELALTDIFNPNNYYTKDEVDEAVKDSVKYQEFGNGRKTIQLANYDNISGVDTDGNGHNLVMLSKWNVADFGAKGIHVNLNGVEGERPTYNDTEGEIAFVSDLDAKANAADVYTKAEIDGKGYLTEHQDISDLATKEEVAEKQDKGNYLSYIDDNGRKVIALNNNDIIGANANEGELDDKIDTEGWVSLIHLNKWNVVDLGSNKTITNINTPDGERPTVQEKSQSGPQAHKIAYLDDVEGLQGNVYTKAETDEKIDARVTAIVDGAPEALDTLKEIADALKGNDDAVAAITTTLGDKADKSEISALNTTVEGLGTKVIALEKKDNEIASQINNESVARQSEDEKIMESISTLAVKNDVDAALEGKQDKGNYISYTDNNGRKVITFNNADIIGAIANEEELEDKYPASGWQSLIQLNKWNVVDLGSNKTMTNINTPDGVRPTIQERSQSGPEAHKMAYLDDVEVLKTIIEELKSRIEVLENK